MNFIETNLKGAFLLEETPLKDERGMFTRVFCKKDFTKIGHTKEFVQFNHSFNFKKGTIRGMHFQRKPHSEIKLIRCIAGSVFDVIIDLRENSPTFLKWLGLIISKENRKMIYIPEGFAHGFQTLEDSSELIYHHTEYHTPSSEGRINPFDKTICIKWPVEISIYSEMDKNAPHLDEKFKGI